MCHMKFDSPDKHNVIKTLFKKCTETINELSELDSIEAATLRVVEICKLKVNESPTDAAEIIKTHDFEMKHLPAHLICEHEVWEVLIPKLNFRELLIVFGTLHSLNMLKHSDSLSKKISTRIGDRNLIKSSNMHPLEILPVLKGYEKNERYNESVKVCLLFNTINIITQT